MNQVISKSLEKLLNHALHQYPPSSQLLNKLAGKMIGIELSGIDIYMTLFLDNQSITILNDYEGEVDVCISGAPFTLLHVLLQKQPNLANNPEITITGDISIAQPFLELLKELNIDWEEQAAQWFGDIPAHHLSHWFRQIQAYTQDRLNTLQMNLGEYLQEEAHHLPSSAEIDIFLNEVDTLRDDLERLEQRIERIQQQMTTTTVTSKPLAVNRDN